jgi:hypothetical protein
MNPCFSYYFCLMIEGSGTGSVSMTNESGSATLVRSSNSVCVQLAHPHSADRQRDRADEHALQGEVPQGHPADGGAAQQLHQRS